MTELPMFDFPRIINRIFFNTIENHIVLMDNMGKVVAINPAFSKSFGYQPQDVIGKKAEIFFTSEDRKNRLPEKEIQKVLKYGQASDNNYLVSKSGNRIWVSGESILISQPDNTSYIVKLIQNIHTQKEAEIALNKLHSFTEDILFSIRDLVIVLNEGLEIIKVNKPFLDLFVREITFSNQLNFNTFIEYYDKENSLLHSIQQAFSTNVGFSNVILEIATTNMEMRMFEISGSIINSAVRSKSILLVFHEITLFKQLEREREDIIGFVAHEIRNPLSNIGLCNELLAFAISENKFIDIPELINKNTNNILRLNKMVSELYNATKISSGNIQLDISPYHFGQMIREAVDTIKILQPSYNIIIKGNGDFIVEGDRYRMIEIVSNYLSNGIKYSNGSTDVVLTIEKDIKSVTVSVKDNGLGISKHQLPFIFERFFRAEKTRNLEGLGLGLYFCRRIVNAHRGKVWAESQEGKGSVFYFSIPLCLL